MEVRSRWVLWALALALLWPATAAASSTAERGAVRTDTAVAAVRVFFVSDAHSRHLRVARFVEHANRERPDVVLEAGDLVHDGTEAEFRRAMAARAALRMPWYAVPGNHDLELRGEFDAAPPAFPSIRSADVADLRIVLLDNHDETLSDEQFEQLETLLSTAGERRTLVVMHVPPALSREPAALRIRHLLPFRLASPIMREPDQVARFKELMERFQVVAVLAGHTHFPDHFVRGGVHYVTTGALGGLTPGLGIPNQYTDLVIDGRDVVVRRVAMGDPPREPIGYLARAFRFYADLNRFNHREEGWMFVPSASVEWRGAVRRIDRDDDREDTALRGAASFERLLGARGRRSFHADLGASAGAGTTVADLHVGYRLRPVGDFNRGLFVGAGVTANGGWMDGAPTAGVGAQVGVGAGWRNWSLEWSRGQATNHGSAELSVGYRY